MVIDHPHVGSFKKNLIYELNNNKQYEGELISLEKIVWDYLIKVIILMVINML